MQKINEAYHDNFRGGEIILRKIYRDVKYRDVQNDEFRLLIDNIISAETGFKHAGSLYRYSVCSKKQTRRSDTNSGLQCGFSNNTIRNFSDDNANGFNCTLWHSSNYNKYFKYAYHNVSKNRNLKNGGVN